MALSNKSADSSAASSTQIMVSPNRRAGVASWYSLAILLIATILSSVDGMLVTLLTEPMRLSLSLSDTQIGMLKGAGLVLFSGLATLPLAWLGDHFDRRLVLATCVLIWSAATGLRGAAMDYTVLFIASIGLGVGEAGLVPLTNSLIPDLFPRVQRILANGIFSIAALLGSALGAMLGGSIVEAIGKSHHLLSPSLQAYETWRLTFFAMAIVGAPVMLLVLTIRSARGAAAVGYEPPPSGTSDLSATAGIGFGDYLRNHWRTLTCLVIAVGFASVGLGSIGSWVPLVAARQFGVQPAQLGQGIGLAVLTGTLLGGIIGIQAMRVSRRRVGLAAPIRVMMLGYCAAGLISIALLFVRSSIDVFLLLSVLMVPLICGAVALPNMLQEVAPAHLRARVIGLLSVGGLPFAVLGPLAIGMISDAVKHQPNGLAMAIVAATMTGCLLGAALLRMTEPAFVRLIRTVNPAA